MINSSPEINNELFLKPTDQTGVFKLKPHRTGLVNSLSDPEIPLPIEIYDQIGELKGIKIIQRLEALQGVSCYSHLATVLAIKHFTSVNIEKLAEDPVDYLPTKGYRQVSDSPISGDIVIYLDSQSNKYPHVGIYGDDKVVSKWGDGHVYSHPINIIPNIYGDSFILFRKE